MGKKTIIYYEKSTNNELSDMSWILLLLQAQTELKQFDLLLKRYA
jgi:hypothetical protein